MAASSRVGRRLRAGRAERDHRRGRRRAGEFRDLRLNQAFLIGAGVDPSAVRENLRPFAQGDLQKFRRDRPEIAVGVIAQSIEGVDRNIFDVQFVDEGAELGGQRIGGRRRRCDEKRLALMQAGRAACIDRDERAPDRFRPLQNELRQQQASFQLFDRRGEGRVSLDVKVCG